MKAGYVSFLGLPNAGKSSLYNALLGEKLAIVSSRAQSTRKSLKGVLSGDDWQMILVDAPGILETAKRPLHEFMQEEIELTQEGSDLVLAVLNLDAEKKELLDQVIERAKSFKKPWAAILTKTDLPEAARRKNRIQEELKSLGVPALEFSSKWNKEDFDLFFDEFVKAVRPLLPDQQQFLVEPDLLSLERERDLVQEMILESCFDHLFEEVPHYLAVQVREFQEPKSDQDIYRIHADLIVSKESHKPLVIGKDAEMIKKIGEKARQQIEKFLGKKVFLKLFVVVKKDWEKSSSIMKSLGFSKNKKSQKKKVSSQ